MEHEVKQFGWKRNLDYLKARVVMGLKENKEYKVNLYMSILNDGSVLIVSFLFFSIYSNLLNNKILSWTNYDFLVYTILIYSTYKFNRLFSFKRIRNILLEGKFNSILSKPINPYIFLSFVRLSGFRIVTTIFIYLMLFSMLFYGNYVNILIGLSVYFFGSVYFLLSYNLIYSLAFFIKENEPYILLYQSVDRVLRYFTPKIFESNFIFYFAILFPISITGYVTLEIFKGNLDVLIYVYISIIIFFILVMMNILIWHYGLKKYEAFG